MKGSGIILILALLSTPASAETCLQLKSQSAVDRAFLEALKASPIPHAFSRPDQPCFADSALPKAHELRAKIEAKNPTSCMTFKKAWNVPALESELESRGVSAWRQTGPPSITICHLVRDTAEVRAAVQKVLPQTK